MLCCSSTPRKGADTSARVRALLEIPFPSPPAAEVAGLRGQREFSLYILHGQAQADSVV